MLCTKIMKYYKPNEWFLTRRFLFLSNSWIPFQVRMFKMMIVIQGNISTKMTSDPNTYKMMYHRFFRSFVIPYNLFLQSTLSTDFRDKFCLLEYILLTISFRCFFIWCESFSHLIGNGLVLFGKIGMSLFIFWLVIISLVS